MSNRLEGEARDRAKRRAYAIAGEISTVEAERRRLQRRIQDLRVEQAALNAAIYAAGVRR